MSCKFCSSEFVVLQADSWEAVATLRRAARELSHAVAHLNTALEETKADDYAFAEESILDSVKHIQSACSKLFVEKK
jgi:predicted trehalose synthase